MPEIESIDYQAIDRAVAKIKALVEHAKKLEPEINAEAAILWVVAALQSNATKWKAQ